MECVEQNSCNDPGYIMPSGRCINIDVDEDHFSFIRVDQSCLKESLVAQEIFVAQVGCGMTIFWQLRRSD